LIVLVLAVRLNHNSNLNQYLHIFTQNPSVFPYLINLSRCNLSRFLLLFRFLEIMIFKKNLFLSHNLQMSKKILCKNQRPSYHTNRLFLNNIPKLVRFFHNNQFLLSIDHNKLLVIRVVLPSLHLNSNNNNHHHKQILQIYLQMMLHLINHTALYYLLQVHLQEIIKTSKLKNKLA